MGAWSAGILDADAAWDFVDELLRLEAADRLPSVVVAFGEAEGADNMQIDDAYRILVGALLVSIARGPANMPGERLRLLDHAGRVSEAAHSVAGFLGPLKGWRAPALSQAAANAIAKVRSASEASELWSEDAQFAETLNGLVAVLTQPLQKWTASQVRGLKRTGPQPFKQSWENGGLLAIDLGDGFRTYGQMMESRFVAYYGRRDPVTDRIPSSIAIVSAPIIFITNLNDFLDRPETWRTVGLVPGSEYVPAVPTQFMQARGYPQDCTLIIGGSLGWDHPVPASQQDCIGLERAGVAWNPQSIETRLKCHFAGVADPFTEGLRIRISRSLARVVSADELAEASQRHRMPVVVHEDGRRLLAYPVDEVATRALAYGHGRSDLVVLEMDEAVVHDHITVDSLPEAGVPVGSPDAKWYWVTGLVDRYTLKPLSDGYRLEPSWSPKYP